MSRESSSDEGLSMDTLMGLSPTFCEAWTALQPTDRAACLHTFQNANQPGRILPSLVEACGTAMADAMSLDEQSFTECMLDTSDVPASKCSVALRPALILGDNPKVLRQVRRDVVQRGIPGVVNRDGSTDIELIKAIVHKRYPTTDDVFALTRLCNWHRGSKENVDANAILAERFLLELPLESPAGYDRTLCTKANADCAHFVTSRDVCHAVQTKFANNAMRLKVEQAGGRANLLPGQQLAASQIVYPDPYGITFMDIAAACNSDRLQHEVAQVLQSERSRDVNNNANICGRIERTTSYLPPMTESFTQLASFDK